MYVHFTSKFTFKCTNRLVSKMLFTYGFLFLKDKYSKYSNLKFCTLLDIIDTNKCAKYLVLIMCSSGPKLLVGNQEAG